MNQPVPTIQQREHMRQVRRLHRRDNGVIAIRAANGHHRNASKKVMEQLIDTHGWMFEPEPGVFTLTRLGLAALARSQR